MLENTARSGIFKQPLAVLAALLLLQVALFYPSYWSMVEIWWRSETFAHGFFIFPISAYLMWRRRRFLHTVDIENDWRALIFLIVLSFLWLVAHVVDVLVVQQFAVVAMLPVLLWLCLGWRMLVALSFPLVFLLFAVPFGDFLVYPLMKFTATFTVYAIRLVGVPVFWEGLYFSLPSGSWSVVEACSGFRYILASLTLGALYAYLSYHSIWRRAAFMLFALIVPIVANGLRAFMIVMIGHVSGMELAVGVDHLIYGWVWFGIVMFVMFWIGSFWQDNCEKVDADSAPTGRINKKCSGSLLVLPIALSVLMLPVWLAISATQVTSNTRVLALPKQVNEWQLVQDEQLSQWQPFYQGATQQLQATYRNGQDRVGVSVATFAAQQQGAELASSSHRLTEGGQKIWKELFRSGHIAYFDGYEIELTEARIKSKQQNLLVWQWKYFDGARTTSDLYIKILEALAKFKGGSEMGAALIVFIETTEADSNSKSIAQAQLSDFMKDFLPLIEAEIDNAQ